jgi:hypothetical protein
MVDALRESWRVLSADGIIVDLRPLSSTTCPIEFVTAEEAISVAEVDASGLVEDDVAADRAIERVVQDGWFRQRQASTFQFEFSWDNVDAMATFIKGSRRIKRVTPSCGDLEKAHRSHVARAGRGARVRYMRPMLLAVYQRCTGPSGAGPHLPQFPKSPMGSPRKPRSPLPEPR